jgi:hypothetical protein
VNAQDKPLILILVKRATIFMFVICSLSFIYWIIGSSSHFLDETQAMLLWTMRLSSLGIVASSGFGIAIALCYALSRRYRPRIMGLVGYLVVSALGLGSLYLAQSVIVLSRGLR